MLTRQPLVATNTESALWPDRDKQRKKKHSEIQLKLAIEMAWIKLGSKVVRSGEGRQMLGMLEN